MSERTTSREEADEMKRVIDRAIDDLERAGFDRGQIGAAMAGIGLAVAAVHNGKTEGLRILDSVRDALLLDGERARN